ncbi:hypothetical protein D9757_009022 [Collybiopsis confluens]|uniref:Glucose-methanol-choline oxidoreductase N-terminal domain-containing protein n=1 Tax=Collybiopsis confluens TaxID=2823264 RepID=A0A8H5HDZ9_9AGAR|nr:hypothetical protein D9757_009022 [Collybiopsis confluens]
MRLYLQQFLSVYILVLPALLPQGVPATVIINDSSELPLQSYDYIVVGGGTTGLAVANRLAVEYSVLVVERGPDLVDNEDINNPFTTYGTPSPCRFSMEGAPQIGSNGVKPMRLTYGSCLGGGSSINGLMGARPTFAGMNAVEALGNPGWGWNNFLPYMQKSETFTPPDPIQITEGADYIASVHGFSGPVGVSFAQPLVAPKMQGAAKSTVKSVFDDAVTLTPDMGDGFSGGHVASLYHHIHFNQTLQSDRRSSSAWSYLYPELQQRVGLAVLTGHRVNSLVTLKSASGNVTAVGVRVQPTSGGQIFTLDVSKEVVVTAGALYSPAILQRSGIGNSTYLKGLGITPVLDLPGVGANFQDQPYLVNVSFPLAPSNNITSITGGADTLVGVVVAHLTARNALGSEGLEQLRYFDVTMTDDDCSEGATEMNSLIRNISADKALSVGGVVQSQTLITQARLTADAYEIDHPIVEFFFNPTLTVLQVWAQSILPLSRGFIRINTTDPSEDPIADAQYLTQDVDVQIMVAAARVVSKIASSPPFSNLLSPNALADSGVPGVNATDDQVKQWVLSTYTAGIHFVGSNAMMPKDLGGVVSPELLVYGTSNIRIADASVIPLSVFPHTTLGLYGVAEKAAEVIVQRAKDEAHSI